MQRVRACRCQRSQRGDAAAHRARCARSIAAKPARARGHCAWQTLASAVRKQQGPPMGWNSPGHTRCRSAASLRRHDTCRAERNPLPILPPFRPIHLAILTITLWDQQHSNATGICPQHTPARHTRVELAEGVQAKLHQYRRPRSRLRSRRPRSSLLRSRLRSRRRSRSRSPLRLWWLRSRRCRLRLRLRLRRRRSRLRLRDRRDLSPRSRSREPPRPRRSSRSLRPVELSPASECPRAGASFVWCSLKILEQMAQR